MRPAERGLGGFHIGEDFFHLVKFAEIGAENGVDETGLRDVAGTFGLLNSFVDGGVRRNAVEPKNLVEAEAQQIHERGTRLASGRGLARDEPVERGLPAHDAADEFVAQAAIRWRQARGRERSFEKIFSKFSVVQALR